MQVLRHNDELRDDAPHGCVLVPTMGALHAGHAALIARGVRTAREQRRRAIVTVFINPTQFNDPADFAAYPKTLDHDLAVCADAGADAVFAPRPEDVYPPGENVPTPPLPPVATEPGLEDAFRPGHFAGVAQVVLRLFRMCEPAVAVFGEKDWQQLQVVRAIAHEHVPGLVIEPAPTVREPDGLAMSSRNARLAPGPRLQAAALSRALAAGAIAETPQAAEHAMRRVLEDAGVQTEYAVVREAHTLRPLQPDARAGEANSACRALVAGWVGGVRLIDNVAWPSVSPRTPAPPAGA